MTGQRPEGFFSKTEWKFLGFLTLTVVLFLLYYGLPLLGPLFALATDLRSD